MSEAEPDKPDGLFPINERFSFSLEPGSILGSGGQGHVYEGYDNKLNKKVAIKVSNGHLSTEDSKAQTEKEAKKIANIFHGHIIKVYDLANFELDGQPKTAFVMDYINPKSNLANIIENKVELPNIAIESLIHQIGDSLDLLHKNNMYHKDIKPANLFLENKTPDDLYKDQWVATLIDLGIDSENATDEKGRPLGSIKYVPIEVFGSKEINEPTRDIYSLAIVAFETIVGEKLREDNTISEIHKKAKHNGLTDKDKERLRKAAKKRGLDSNRMVEIINKALSAKREDRYQSGKEFANALFL